MMFRNSRFAPALLAAAVSIAAAGATLAATDARPAGQESPATTATAALTAGEVRKVDAAQGRVTIRHEPIGNLDMPAMTMVFRAAQPEMLKDIQAGDRIGFRAENVAGAFVVTEIRVRK